jgi:hypothetical protein
VRFPLDFEKNVQVKFLDIDSHERNEGESKFGFFKLLGTAANIILSLMTIPRLITWCFVALLLAVAAFSTLPLLSIFFIIGALLLILRYNYLASARYLKTIRVSESANVILPNRS